MMTFRVEVQKVDDKGVHHDPNETRVLTLYLLSSTCVPGSHGGRSGS